MPKDVPEFRAYLSSTIEDLKEEREAAVRVLRKYAVVKDSYRSSEQATVETCERDVRECHVYIGIIGQRYGWVPDGEDKPGAKSITEIEYEACHTPGQPRIDRHIFIRTTNPDRFNDALTRPTTAERIRRFRERADKDQQPFKFDTLKEFELALSEAISEARQAFHRKHVEAPPIFDQRKSWNSALRPVALFAVPSPDDSVTNALVQLAPSLFTKLELSPVAPDLSMQVDLGAQKGQLGCLVITPALLHRLSEPPLTTRFEKVFGTMRRRFGVAALLCVDSDPATLPQRWQPIATLALKTAVFQKTPEQATQEVYTRLRALATLTPETRLALPCLVVAQNEDEIKALAAADGAAFAAFDEDEREERRKQFAALAKAANEPPRNWPQSVYGRSRFDWRCFGEGTPTVGELIGDVVGSVNTALRGSREREVLQDAKVVVRQYDLDEYLNDEEGSRATIVAMRNRGCLIVVDEVALLHPSLRKAASDLLAAPHSAIVSISPCDPQHMPTRRLLGAMSFLRVGPIVERFKTEQDPQCELALTSEERLRRWLRAAIPRLLLDVDGLSGRPRLAGDADKLFATGP
jgi:hypothetical protein